MFDSNNGISKYCLRDRMISNPNPQTVNKIQRSYSFFGPERMSDQRGILESQTESATFLQETGYPFSDHKFSKKMGGAVSDGKNASCMKGETGNCKSQESISADAWKCAGTAIYTTGNTNPKIREKTPNPPSARLQKTDFSGAVLDFFEGFQKPVCSRGFVDKTETRESLQECPQQNSLDPFFLYSNGLTVG
ncbi:hypothetical protein [Allobaculum sp. Allo2]|uniref:hypothetical protein n=1 Tax=Allobaculum sp. Allo2 TaxID=2853432 RepID=UPI001F603840|nr:hypothetical protein [Allobaculum sp. Allo2]UNT92662.1 hypothetical protein KWG61_11095 [Allobaculum sp. Allo2]